MEYYSGSRKCYVPANQYWLADERDLILGILSSSVSRFQRHGFKDPVNAIELGYWLDGYRLMVFFVHDPAYFGAGQVRYDANTIVRDGQCISYAQRFDMLNWAMPRYIARQDEHVRGIEVMDMRGQPVASTYGDVFDAIGQHLLHVAVEHFDDVFVDMTLAETVWISSFEDSASGGWMLAGRKGGKTRFFPEFEEPNTPDWFYEHAKLIEQK